MDPNFWSNGRAQKQKQMKEEHIFWSNGRVHITNKSVGTRNSGRMVVNIASAKVQLLRATAQLLIIHFYSYLPSG